jgi:hypothetical protein
VKKIEIKWLNVYSDNMEADEHNRWARKAIVGDFDKLFIDNKAAIFQIAWINKKDKWFIITTYFPFSGKSLFSNLDEAKKEVEDYFQHFVNCLK